MRTSNLTGTARIAALMVALSIAVSGCFRDDPPCCVEPFGPVTVTTVRDGFAGVNEKLMIDVDGAALFMGNQPVGGKMRPGDLAELRRLLTGTQIRREAGNRDDSDRCSDGVTRTLRMGRLLVDRELCQNPAKAPAFERALALTSPDRLQRLVPLPTAPLLPALTVTRAGDIDLTPARYAVSPVGVMTVRRNGQSEQPAALRPDKLDALRLLLVRPVRGGSESDCRGYAYRVSVAGPQPASAAYCDRGLLRYPVLDRYADLAAIIRVLLDAAGDR